LPLCKTSYSLNILIMSQQLSHQENEYNKLIKIFDFRLPHRFKLIGYLGVILILAFLFGHKFLVDGSLAIITKDILRTLILLFMLFASLSRDTFEDEFNRYVRFQSYVIAFVCAVVYSISIPLIAILLDILITKITGDGTISFYEISSFEVLFILMGLQLLFFETLKRFGRA